MTELLRGSSRLGDSRVCIEEKKAKNHLFQTWSDLDQGLSTWGTRPRDGNGRVMTGIKLMASRVHILISGGSNYKLGGTEELLTKMMHKLKHFK